VTGARGIAVTLFLLFPVSSGAVASDAVSFPELAGTYLSSMRGGCELELKKDGSFALACLAQHVRKGQVHVVGKGFRINGSADASVAVVRRLPPLPSSGAEDSADPLVDPTSGPLVVSTSEDDRSLLLKPLRWGARLYLVQADAYEAFCREIKTGLEPRKEAGGTQFLRRGDHRKTADANAPMECAGSK
jgi:hypothetical protein